MNKLCVCGVATLAVGLVAQADIFIGPEGDVVTNITADTVQTERVLTYGGGKLVKSGGAKLSLPVGVIEDRTPFVAAVVSGKVDVVTTAVSLGVPTLPASLTDKAKLWFDASLYDTKPYLFPGATSNDHTYVDQWYDVRETAESVVGTPLRPYCQAHYKRPSDGKAYYDARRKDGSTAVYSPEIVLTNGFRAMWFGGVTASRNYMWTKTNRKDFESTRDITSAFIVHGAFESVGNLLGVTLYNNPWVFTGPCSGTMGVTDKVLVSADGEAVWGGAQVYRNGEQLNMHSAPKATIGFQLLEVNSHTPFYANSFFNERYHSCNEGAGNRNGGDFICEALIFNKELTSAERAQVTAYLMAKWNLKGGSAKNLAVAKAGELALDAGAGGLVATNMSIVGSGTVRKSGEATIVNTTVGHDAFTGAVVLEEGAIDVRRQQALAVSDGTTLDSSATEAGAAGNKLSLAAAAAGSLVKTGKAEATVTGVPATVSRLDVQDGTLKIRPPRQAELLDEQFVRQAFPSNDVIYYNGFEGWANEYTTGYWDDGWSWANVRCGFKYVSKPLKADGSEAGARFFHVINGHWKDENGKPQDPSGWGFPYNSTGDGDGYIAWRYGPAYATEVTFPEAGTYEVSFALAARSSQGNRPVYVELMTTDLTWTNTFHTSFIPEWSHGNAGKFNFDKAQFTVATAGTYYLGFRNTTIEDKSTCLDAVTVRRVRPSCVGARQTGWLVPGGDFGWQFVTNDVNAYRYADKVNVTVSGWDFSTPCVQTNQIYRNSGWATVPTASVATRDAMGLQNNGVAIFIDGLGADNYGQAYFPGHGATIKATFTPPKGLWRVAAEMATATGPDYSGKVVNKAKFVGTLASGAGNVDLGSCYLGYGGFQTQAFAPLLSSDGETPWTVSIAFDASELVGVAGITNTTHATLDNLRLVNAVGEGGALLDPSFETMMPWTASGNVPMTDYAGTPYTCYGDVVKTTDWNWTHQQFGSGRDEYPDGGTACIRLGGEGFVKQTVGLMAGRYRLSFYSRSRWLPGNNWYQQWGCNPIGAYLAQDGVTNLITVASCTETNLVEHVAEFQVLEDGVYDFVLKGLCGSSEKYPLRVNNVGAESLVDSVSIVPIEDPEEVVFGDEPDVTVASGARLELDFNGTNVVKSVRLGGRKVKGFVDSATYPDYISGTGVLYAKPSGIILLVY